VLEIFVCIKAVPDPDEADKIKIDPVSKTLTREEIPLVLNPLDKNALEAALQIKEAHGGRISVISMGPSDAGKIVKECLALGADQGFLLSDPAFAGADTLATAFTLAKGIEKIGRFDVIFCGMASADGATEWVGPEISTFLDIPVVTLVKEVITDESRRWKVKASLDNGYRLVAVELPAVFTTVRELNVPRTLSFSGIIKARKKEIVQWDLQDLGLEAESVGLAGSPTLVSDLSLLETGRTVEMLEGSREEKVEQLVHKLAEAGVV
jgi:electron transfer flavoprotein beta subunit